MPLYEYRCQRCDEVFEVMQRFSDDPLTTHENCGGTVERLLSAPALQFKGSGWYITDYARAGNNGNGAKEAGKEAKDGASKDESKSEKKAEAKTESKPAPAATGSGDKK